MSKKTDPVYTVVEGRFDFPIDMLRYDRATPAREVDSLRIVDTGTRRVMVMQEPGRSPTVGRWASFGWTVIASSTDKYEMIQVLVTANPLQLL